MSDAEGAELASRSTASRIYDRLSRIPCSRIRAAACFLIVLGAIAASSAAQNLRVVEGRVIGSKNQPLENAIVYLEDQKSMEVKSYITEADGKFRFGQLGSDDDYQLWAKYRGQKSSPKSISSFDSRKQFDFDLKVDTGK